MTPARAAPATVRPCPPSVNRDLPKPARHGNDSRQAAGCSRRSRSPLSWGQLLWDHGSCCPGAAWAKPALPVGSGLPPLLTGSARNGELTAGGRRLWGGAELSRFVPGIGPRGTGAIKLGQSDDLHGPHPLPALRRIGRGGGISLLRPRLVAGEQWLAPGRGGGLFPGVSRLPRRCRAPRPSTALSYNRVRFHGGGAAMPRGATCSNWTFG